MHRQSLGSPSSTKLHLHHHVAVANEEQTLITADDDESPKLRRLSSPPPTPHKFIHFIPILTLLCFFVLYLFSHTPSSSDLNNFTGFKRLHNHKHNLDSAAEMSDIFDAKRSDVLAIRSLQQIRLHRKLADF